MTRSPDGGEGWRGPDESGRRAHGRRVRVRGRGEVGPKGEAVAPRQARAGRARRPRDRRGRARRGRPGRRPRRPPPGGGPAARAAGDVGPGAVSGPPRSLRGLRPAVALPRARGHPRHAPRRPDRHRRPPGPLGPVGEEGRDAPCGSLARRHGEGDRLSCDTTSASSRSEALAQVRRGRDEDRVPLPQASLAMPVGHGSGMPPCYRGVTGTSSS